MTLVRALVRNLRTCPAMPREKVQAAKLRGRKYRCGGQGRTAPYGEPHDAVQQAFTTARPRPAGCRPRGYRGGMDGALNEGAAKTSSSKVDLRGSSGKNTSIPYGSAVG